MMVVAEGLGKLYPSGGRTLAVLREIDLAVAAGELVAIIGPSGSGKTTLLGLLAGLDRPSSGQVRLDGQDLALLTEDGRARLRAEKIGFVFQTFHLLPTLTALENVLVPLELSGAARLNGRSIRERAVGLLERVGLGERLDHYPTQLSGGEQQRVALARAFANEPRILFADEPTGNLDAETGRGVIDLLFELNRESGVTVVLVTHDPELAARADRVVRLAGGRIVEDSRRVAAGPGGAGGSLPGATEGSRGAGA
jgi:putative ABC transport system ATP-binding protein